ncbi:MAG: lipid-binding SYLF domain-containing protein, partial [Thermoguttaceae bacterium]|nr:lipid-binding SYLF domain-containing protein [Thermoguttaceae bacterium]
ILVFCSRRSVEAALAGRFTIGADANVAAGPVGRQTSASTDILLTSEIYSWSKSRGIFLGVSLDGCVMEINPSEANSYYMNGIPDDAKKLVQMVAEYASPQQSGNKPAQNPAQQSQPGQTQPAQTQPPQSQPQTQPQTSQVPQTSGASSQTGLVPLPATESATPGQVQAVPAAVPPSNVPTLDPKDSQPPLLPEP